MNTLLLKDQPHRGTLQKLEQYFKRSLFRGHIWMKAPVCAVITPPKIKLNKMFICSSGNDVNVKYTFE